MAQQQEKSYIHAGNRKSNPHWIWGQIADLFVKSGRTIEKKPSNRRLVGQIRKNSVKEDIFEVSQVKKSGLAYQVFRAGACADGPKKKVARKFGEKLCSTSIAAKNTTSEDNSEEILSKETS